MLGDCHRRREITLSSIKNTYYFLLPWAVYIPLGLILEAVETHIFPLSTGNPLLLLYYAVKVAHILLLISLSSVLLIKSVSVSKAVLLWLWEKYTPPYDSELDISNETQPVGDLVPKAKQYGVSFLTSGFLAGMTIPFYGEVPLRQGTISFIELPDLPYDGVLAEVLSGFPIVGDLFILSFISVQSTILYIPISISVFLMIVGVWNLSYASRHFLEVNGTTRRQKRWFNRLATISGLLAIVYVYIFI